MDAAANPGLYCVWTLMAGGMGPGDGAVFWRVSIDMGDAVRSFGRLTDMRKESER